MAVAAAILNPQDVLKRPISRKPLISAPPKPKHHKTPKPPVQTRPNRKPRRCPTPSRAWSPTVEKPAVPLLAGAIKILKRGEVLPEPTPDHPPKEGILGPALISDGFYAGTSTCIVSPPPSSLPLPAFFAKKVVRATNCAASDALIKILRLDLD